MEVKEVSDGYARNFLIARKLGVLATAEHLAEKNRFEKDEAGRMQARIEEQKRLKETALVFYVKTGTHGEVFSSVTAEMIEGELKKKGFSEVSVTLERHLKKLETHLVEVGLPKSLQASVKVTLQPEVR